jgi:hypothetical protein
MRFEPGTRVHCEMSKWGGRPHWEYDGTYLGTDELGDWIGFPTGTRFTRPGQDFTARNDQVGLVPAPVDGTGERPWFLATFHATGGALWPALGGAAVAVYVDMTSPAEWDGTTLRAVDLDLDVIRGMNDRVVIDDEDEFAEHQVAFGYPADVIAAARTSCDRVHAAVVAGLSPYDGSHRPWLDRLAELT